MPTKLEHFLKLRKMLTKLELFWNLEKILSIKSFLFYVSITMQVKGVNGGYFPAGYVYIIGIFSVRPLA